VTPAHLIFDLDNTLYPPTLGVVERVDALINGFMIDRLGMTPEAANATRARYREEHGTTLSGLMLHHHVVADEYLAHVHAIEIEDLVQPDAALLAMLDGLPQRKVVFTNGSACHAERVLGRLGVRHCFAEVFSLERVDYVPKPLRAAFESVLGALGAPAAHCLVIDDQLDNLRTARALGMRTVLVDPGPAAPDEETDFTIVSVLDLPRVLEEAADR